MAEIATIHGGSRPGEPVDSVIEQIEELLDDARAGKITAVAWATMRADGALTTSWAGAAGTRYKLGGALLMLQHRFAAYLLDRGD